MTSENEEKEWVGKARVLQEVKILNYTKSADFDLEVEDCEDVVWLWDEEKRSPTVKKIVPCKLVKKIVVKIPKMNLQEAEAYLEEKAQIIADYIAFCQKKKVTIELDSISETNGRIRLSFNPGYRHVEEIREHIPQPIDFKLIENIDEDTITQLSNYNYGLEFDNLARLKGNYKVIEMQNEKDPLLKKAKTERHLESHAKLEKNKTHIEKAEKILGRASLRPTHFLDREKIRVARQLQEYAEVILLNKIKIKQINGEEMPGEIIKEDEVTKQIR